MVKCHKCGHNNEEGHEFCEECGSKLKVELKCKKCGHHLKPDDDFCEECGATVKESKALHHERKTESKLAKYKWWIISSIIVVIVISIFLSVQLFKKPSKTIETTAPKTEVVQKINVTVGEQKKPETLEKKQNVFTLSQMEYNSINKATLRFIPFCGNVNELGTLDIFINDKKIFSTIPVCDNAYKQSIPKNLLNEGENGIEFISNRGSYSVEQIKIVLEVGDSEIEKSLPNVFLVETEKLDVTISQLYSNECSQGQKRCRDSKTRQDCTFTNNYYVWGSIWTCASDEICQNGVCVVAETCQHNSIKCLSASTYSVCRLSLGQYRYVGEYRVGIDDEFKGYECKNNVLVNNS